MSTAVGDGWLVWVPYQQDSNSLSCSSSQNLVRLTQDSFVFMPTVVDQLVRSEDSRQ